MDSENWAVHVDSTGSPSSTIVDQDAPSPSNSQTTPKTEHPVIPNDVEEDNHDIEVAHMGNDPYFGVLIPEIPSNQSSSSDSIHTIMHPDYQISKHNSKWTKDHPLENIISELARPVSTRLQLHEQALFCYYDAFLTFVEPKTYKDALTQTCWIEAMQEELNEFERLEVWGARTTPTQTKYECVFAAHEDKRNKVLIPNRSEDCVSEMESAGRGLRDFSKVPRGILLTRHNIPLNRKEMRYDSCDQVDTPIVEKSKLDEE
ncbi:hypothetical protein Tco_1203498 [Tanacetum coccineum]